MIKKLAVGWLLVSVLIAVLSFGSENNWFSILVNFSSLEFPSISNLFQSLLAIDTSIGSFDILGFLRSFVSAFMALLSIPIDLVKIVLGVVNLF